MDASHDALEAMLAEPSAASLSVRAPARLHLGFLDPAGSLGRPFGSIGVALDGFDAEVELGAAASAENRVAAKPSVPRADLERASASLARLQRHSGRNAPLDLRLLRVAPAHAGFGSGTQLALAIGRAFAQWHGLDVSTPLLAQWLGRGLRSGIGIAGFDLGGLLVDGGPRADGAPAVLLARVALPDAWRVLVVQDTSHEGLSGAAERDGLAALAPLPQAQAADICHQVLMRVLPGAASAEFAPFAAGISRIQRVLGEYFAPAQGGSAYTSAAVGRLIEWIARAAPAHGDAALGQSSWGPTGFAIVPSHARADAIVAAARAAGVVCPALRLSIVAGRNSGAVVVDHRPARRAPNQ